jgi:hypothetical protein
VCRREGVEIRERRERGRQRLKGQKRWLHLFLLLPPLRPTHTYIASHHQPKKQSNNQKVACKGKRRRKRRRRNNKRIILSKTQRKGFATFILAHANVNLFFSLLSLHLLLCLFSSTNTFAFLSLLRLFLYSYAQGVSFVHFFSLCSLLSHIYVKMKYASNTNTLLPLFLHYVYV